MRCFKELEDAKTTRRWSGREPASDPSATPAKRNWERTADEMGLSAGHFPASDKPEGATIGEVARVASEWTLDYMRGRKKCRGMRRPIRRGFSDAAASDGNSSVGRGRARRERDLES